MNKPKVVFFQHAVHAGKIAFFNYLAENTALDFIVYFLSEPAKNRKWKKEDFSYSFNYRQLSGFKIYVPGNDHSYFHFNSDVIRHLRQDKPEVILSFGWNYIATWLAFIYSKFTKTKFGLISESTLFEPSLQRSLTKPLVSLLVKNSDFLFGISTRAKEYFISLGAKSDQVKVMLSTSYEPNKEVSKQEIERTRHELKIKTNDFMLLYVGQLIPRKGIQTILDSANSLKNNKKIQFILVGYGSLETDINNFIARNELNNIRIVNYVDPKNIWNYYFAADAFVLASHEETWGLVVNEAMRAKLPVLLSNKVGSSDDLLIDGKNGFAFNPDDHQALASKISLLASDKLLCKKMGTKSKSIISDITPETQASVLLETLYKGV